MAAFLRYEHASEENPELKSLGLAGRLVTTAKRIFPYVIRHCQEATMSPFDDLEELLWPGNDYGFANLVKEYPCLTSLGKCHFVFSYPSPSAHLYLLGMNVGSLDTCTVPDD